MASAQTHTTQQNGSKCVCRCQTRYASNTLTAHKLAINRSNKDQTKLKEFHARGQRSGKDTEDAYDTPTSVPQLPAVLYPDYQHICRRSKLHPRSPVVRQRGGGDEHLRLLQ